MSDNVCKILARKASKELKRQILENLHGDEKLWEALHGVILAELRASDRHVASLHPKLVGNHKLIMDPFESVADTNVEINLVLFGPTWADDPVDVKDDYDMKDVAEEYAAWRAIQDEIGAIASKCEARLNEWGVPH